MLTFLSSGSSSFFVKTIKTIKIINKCIRPLFFRKRGYAMPAKIFCRLLLLAFYWLVHFSFFRKDTTIIYDVMRSDFHKCFNKKYSIYIKKEMKSFLFSFGQTKRSLYFENIVWLLFLEKFILLNRVFWYNDKEFPEIQNDEIV